MASLVGPRLRQVLRTGGQTALLGFVDHPTWEIKHFWSHSGILEFDGFQWYGLGILGKVSGVTKSNDLGVKQVTISMSGLPPSGNNLLSARVRNRQAQIWLAAVKGRRVIDRELIVDALCDYQTLKVNDDKTSTIVITANVGFWNIERASNKAWTHEQQQADFPGDTGLSLLPQLTNKDSNWRAS